MNAKELKSALDADRAITIVDLQDAHSYQHRHIPGAINVPSTASADECQRCLTDKGANIVVYGEYDELGKGAEAIEGLKKLGYGNVERLDGGMMGWMEAGFAVEGGTES